MVILLFLHRDQRAFKLLDFMLEILLFEITIVRFKFEFILFKKNFLDVVVLFSKFVLERTDFGVIVAHLQKIVA